MERSPAELRAELEQAKGRLAELERDTAPDYTPGSSIPGVPDPEQLPTAGGLAEVGRLRDRIRKLERSYGQALSEGR